MKNRKFFVKKILALEKSFDVHKLQYKSIHIWPLLRYQIFTESSIKIEKKVKLNWKGKIHDEILTHFNFFMEILKLHSIKKKKSILSLSNISGKYIKTSEGLFSKFTDSIRLLIDQANVIDVLVYEKNNIPTSPSKPHFHINNLKKYYSKKNKHLNRKQLNIDFEELNAQLVEFELPTISQSKFLKDLILFDNYISAFDKLHKIIKPRLNIVGCYYDIAVFAFTYSSVKHGIEVLELQHGQQGNHHVMYTHWNTFPLGGYKVIPKKFATWGCDSRKRINRWFLKSNYHQAFLIGNPWHIVNKESLIQEPLNDTYKVYLELLKENKSKGIYNILYCLQPFGNISTIFPDFMLTLMRESENIFWCIRLHPKMNNFCEINEYLKIHRITKYEILMTSEINLFTISNSNYIHKNITHFSSVAYELLRYNIPSIIISKEGKNEMKQYIEQGLFLYADDHDSLLNMINKKNNTDVNKNYIITDKKLFINTINSFLN